LMQKPLQKQQHQNNKFDVERILFDHIENAKNINWFEVLLFRCRKWTNQCPFCI
jgi:hypothetical protein